MHADVGSGAYQRNQSQGFRLRADSDGRLSLGNQFLSAVGKKDDETQLRRAVNIFKNQRTVHGQCKDSAREAEQDNDEEGGIVERDDGGHLVSTD